jgi:hypothetical protein
VCVLVSVKVIAECFFGFSKVSKQSGTWAAFCFVYVAK